MKLFLLYDGILCIILRTSRKHFILENGVPMCFLILAVDFDIFYCKFIEFDLIF